MQDTSRLHINVSAIDRNMAVLRRIVGPECAICPIVKADAYGLGAAKIAPRLAAAGADLLAVYTPEQASVLIKAAVSAPLLILMPVFEIARTDDLYRWLVSNRLHLTVHDESHLKHLLRLAEHYATVIPLHLEVDTGMSRGGATPAAATAMIQTIKSTRWLRLAGLMTHFSNAKADADRTAAQLAQFDKVVTDSAALIPQDCLIHVASTYSVLRHRRYHRSMVRFGLAWAGYGLEELEGGEIIVEGEKLEPVLTWSSEIVQIKQLQTGTSLGYGSMWKAKRPSVVGLIPVGYADGYPAGLGETKDHPNAAQVAVRLGDGPNAPMGYAPVVGVVNMDQITIDLTELVSQAGSSIAVGTRVELISPQRDAPNHLTRVSKAAGTIPHELMCRMNPRLKRVYEVDAAVAESTSRPAAAAG
jgi:alanine racemase